MELREQYRNESDYVHINEKFCLLFKKKTVYTKKFSEHSFFL